MVDSAVLVRGPQMPNPQPIKRRSIEKPRPLRSDPDLVCLGEVLKLMEEVESALNNPLTRNDIRTRIKVQQLKEILRLNGSVVERTTQDTLNALFSTMKDACRDTKLDIITRLNLLEILELRLSKWNGDPATIALYRQKVAEAQLDIDMKKIGFSGDMALHGPATLPAPIWGQNNPLPPPPPLEQESTSLLSLVNSSATSVSTASAIPAAAAPTGVCMAGDAIKQLIQSNQGKPGWMGPVVDRFEDASIGLMGPPDHCASILVNGERVLISSNNKNLVKASRDILYEFFTSTNPKADTEAVPVGNFLKPDICYDKAELLKLRKSPLCKEAPVNWDKIIEELPMIVKKPVSNSKHFLREVEGIRKQEANCPLRKM